VNEIVGETTALDALAALQQMAFPSRNLEDDTFEAVESRIADAVTAYQRNAVATAQTMLETQVAPAVTRAEELLAALRGHGAVTPATLTTEVLRDWDRADKLAAAHAARLRELARAAEWHLERLGSPLLHFTELQDKYPALRRHYF